MKRKQRTLLCCPAPCALIICLSGVASLAAVTPQTYDEWRASLPAAANGPADDADGDGILNVVEYAFGLNPLQPGQGLKLIVNGRYAIRPRPNQWLAPTYRARFQ
jgi:hypothetical protein